MAIEKKKEQKPSAEYIFKLKGIYSFNSQRYVCTGVSSNGVLTFTSYSNEALVNTIVISKVND